MPTKKNLHGHDIGFKAHFREAGIYFEALTVPLRISMSNPHPDATMPIMTSPALVPELARAIANSMRLFGGILESSVKKNLPKVVFSLGSGYEIEMVPDESEVLWSMSIDVKEERYAYDLALTAPQMTFLADMIFIAADVEACAPVPGRDFPVRKPRL